MTQKLHLRCESLQDITTNSSIQADGCHNILSVSELNKNAKIFLERAFSILWVGGEISNLKRYNSGHWYFSLKDTDAQIRCVMFHHKNQYLEWKLEDGMQVEIRALVTLYEERGDFQLNVETIRRAGLGELFKAFEKLKFKLEKEGLFDSARKKLLPPFPKQIGIITSPSGAALRDVLSTLQKRMPYLSIIIYPVPVQGDSAAIKIVKSIQIAQERNECDALILCRGGGSIEDLWTFNEEILARAIFSCTIPIISGIGHETDFTIADFVSDVRAPTPTAASQLVCPDRQELLRYIAILRDRIQRSMQQNIENRMQSVDILLHRLINPSERINSRLQHLDYLYKRIASIQSRYLENKCWYLRELNQRLLTAGPDINRLIEKQLELNLRLRQSIARHINTLVINLQRLQTHLAHLNPQLVLERGYSITRLTDGTVLRDKNQIAIGDTIQVTFAKGWSKAQVSDKGE